MEGYLCENWDEELSSRKSFKEYLPDIHRSTRIEKEGRLTQRYALHTEHICNIVYG